ncbi:hypothetical protein B9Z51_02870 [Limnohabitans sp. T6-5]|uniref:hypothetical protein n=1 Tax=Limnohabitans sp. T6-5 TaxID=1100724 RepID=UPI000D3530EA|nr:hypothetical protein [Limnohabitans sp. T6-5]PUE11267.1 hypothetical protein B9Z51_02870 [Limnohabitans sp. T6-5]
MPVTEASSTLPYPYQSPSQAMSEQAFGPLFKALAWSMVLALLVWYWRLGIDWQSRQGILSAVVISMMAFTAWHIQRSRITLDTDAIEQTWMWRRRVTLKELAFVKVMRVRGLEFLIAPRIYVRNLGGTFTFFYCHDRAMLDEFARLAEALKRHEQRV